VHNPFNFGLLYRRLRVLMQRIRDEAMHVSHF
jgi:hypothetical protein